MGISEKEFKENYVQIPVPDLLVKSIMAAETMWQFDPLEGIIEAPTMTLDGVMIDKPGYNKGLGLFYDPRGMPDMQPIADAPTAEAAAVGLAELHDALKEFAFCDREEDGQVAGQSRAVAVAACLTAVVRRVLPMCPIFLIDAPSASSGKTLLADLIATIPTGRGAGATTWAGNSEEQRKLLTSILVAGDLVVNFDNVNAPIGGPEICRVTTAQESFKDRQLGSTKMLELPTNTMWMFTGINMTVKEDCTTRCLRVMLDAGVENPELRVFERPDLLAYVRERRGVLLHACLTILKAYIAAGKPMVSVTGRPFKLSGRFNEWSSLIAGALVWLDQPDPMGSQASVIADDPVKEARRLIIEEWQEAFGFEPVTAKQLLDADDGDVAYGTERAAAKVLAAIMTIPDGGNSPNAISVKLKTFENTIVDGMKIVRRKADRAKHLVTAWRLVDVASDGLM